MARRKLFSIALTVSATMIGFALAVPGSELRAAQHGGGHHHHHGGRGGFGGFGPFAGFGVGLPGFYAPIIIIAPGMFPTPMPVGMPVGPIMPPPPPGIGGGAPVANMRQPRVQIADPARAAQLLVVGDRLLRAGNLKKAEERYLQAMRNAPDLAAPRVRLAQVAIARGNYAEAASRLREAETAEPGWIVTAPIFNRFSANLPISLARLRRLNLTCRRIPTIAMRGWCWGRSGSCRDERRRPRMYSSGWMIRPGSRMWRLRRFWTRRISRRERPRVSSGSNCALLGE